MTFQKKHKLGFTTDRDKPMSASVSFRIDEELAQDLKSISDWQSKLRCALPELIKKWNEA